jgi:hypothetical protein
MLRASSRYASNGLEGWVLKVESTSLACVEKVEAVHHA